METQTNGFIWTLLTRQRTKNHSNKNLNNIIKNKIERANTELNRESDSTKPQSQTRMFSRRKKTFLSFTLSLFYLFVAPVMQVLPVYAAEPAVAHTVWDFMVTQLVGANCIITDSTVLSAYGSALGSLNAATATAAEIDAAIATAAVNCGVDLAPVFANTAAAAADIGVDAVAASAGENLAATCAGFYAAGEGSAVIPAIAQTCVDVLGVAGIVAGISYIAKMVGETVEDVVKYGLKLDQLRSNMNAFEEHYDPNKSCVLLSNNVLFQSNSESVFVYYCNNYNGHLRVYVINKAMSQGDYYIYNLDSGGGSHAYIDRRSTKYHDYYDNVQGIGGIEVNQGDIGSTNSAWSNGNLTLPGKFTPSIVSQNGYLKWDNDGSSTDPDVIVPNIPELRPLPDYSNDYGLTLIPEADYQSIVTQVNNLPSPVSLEDLEANDLDILTNIWPIIDPYIVPIGDPSPGPGTDPQPTGSPDPQPTGSPDPQPTGSPNPNPNPNPKPNTQPFPDQETVPQPTPVVNPTPDSDVVPAPVPYPDPATPSEQDKTDTDTKITPIDLRDKFPFCIPFDILKIMKLFQGGREAPCFTWTIPFGQAGSGEVTVDLSAWDSAATLLRTLELILFIMLLAVGTRNLIGGSS